jgi:Na+-transporting NADH:ubiquinone oxidoreductase subunit C
MKNLNNKSKTKKFSFLYTIGFIIILSLFVSSILSVIKTFLKKPIEISEKFDKSKNMLIAAKILSENGKYFLIQDKDCKYFLANFDSKTKSLQSVDNNSKILKSKFVKKATKLQILDIYNCCVTPLLTDKKGNVFSFNDLSINYSDYINNSSKFSKFFLFYKINKTSFNPTDLYVIPIKGMGLWDKIYGYLVISDDGNTVVGTTFYKQNETAGLGANITNPSFLSNFCHKKIFKTSSSDSNKLLEAPLGITIVKKATKAKLSSTEVDGISGATLTCQGVTNAYKNSLEPYRHFLIVLKKRAKTQNNAK